MVFGRKRHAQAQAPTIPPTGGPPPPPAPTPRQTAASAQRRMTRENDRTVMRAQRDLERERLRLETEERRIMSEIKSLGRKGRMAEARMLAKNLVQVRNAKSKTYQAGVQMSAIGNQAKMAQADSSLMGVMSSATGIMQNANGLMNPEKQMAIGQQFDMETEKYKLNQEMTDEVLDSVLGGDEVDADTDNVLNSVLDEIGLEVASAGVETPAIRPQEIQPLPQQTNVQANQDADLMERIARLGGH